jgi:hypothetical protein
VRFMFRVVIKIVFDSEDEDFLRVSHKIVFFLKLFKINVVY